MSRCNPHREPDRHGSLRLYVTELFGRQAGAADLKVGCRRPRYDWEPAERITGPVWRYAKEERNDPAVAYDDEKHGALRAAITAELQRLLAAAY